MTNPEYVQLGELAYDTVLAVMVANESKHPDAKWKTQTMGIHVEHAMKHCDEADWCCDNEDIAVAAEELQNALTRCAMALQVYQAGAGQ